MQRCATSKLPAASVGAAVPWQLSSRRCRKAGRAERVSAHVSRCTRLELRSPARRRLRTVLVGNRGAAHADLRSGHPEFSHPGARQDSGAGDTQATLNARDDDFGTMPRVFSPSLAADGRQLHTGRLDANRYRHVVSEWQHNIRRGTVYDMPAGFAGYQFEVHGAATWPRDFVGFTPARVAAGRRGGSRRCGSSPPHRGCRSGRRRRSAPRSRPPSRPGRRPCAASAPR